MTAADAPDSVVRNHPFLSAYLAVLLVVWLVSAATWTLGADGALELHPIAQALQYLLVVVAATLAGLRLRVQPRDVREGATFGFYDLRWSVAHDVGGDAFWTAVGIGAGAMVLNVTILVLADLAVAGGAAGVAAYLEWIGAAIAAGAILGMLSAFIAVAVAIVVRRRRA